MRAAFLTSLTMVAFASNSVLCRMALGKGSIDAASFTAIRLVSGVVVLSLLVLVNKQERDNVGKASWFGAAMLFLYAVAFSYAYLSLPTGTGALILFGAVQITMILATLMGGTRLHVSEWAGLLIAFGGLVYLCLPSATAPSPLGFVLMAVAGAAWGIYTMNGRGSVAPLHDTQTNFMRTLPFVAVLALPMWWDAEASAKGVLLAMLSGGLASGVGYAMWYSALEFISSTQAAVVQLSVPVIAALGGVLLLSESVTPRLIISAAMVLGGILLVLAGRDVLVRRRRDPGEQTS